MPTQAPPPPQNYAPISQFFGSFLLGAWMWYGSPYNGWFWVGNGPVGWVGDPWTGYSQIPKPAMPVVPPTAPPPQSPPQSPPPPAPPLTGPPEEVPPPPPPEEGCGQPIAYSAATLAGKLGHDGDDGFRSPVVANMFSLPLHTQDAWSESEDPNAFVSYLTHPKIVKDEQGRLRVVHSGKGSGAVVFAPPELFDYHAYGSDALFNSRWPERISQSSLLVMSGHLLAGTGVAASARQLLAFGLAHPTSAKPKLGWYFDLGVTPDGTNAADLTLSATRVDATDISDPTDYPTLDIKADARVRGKLTVDDLIDPTGLELSPVAANPGGVAANTLWLDSGDSNALKWGANKLATQAYVAAGFQPLDADLTNIAALTGTGFAARTGAFGTWALRALTAGSSRITITNEDGVSGNPTIDANQSAFNLDSIGGTLSVSKGGTGATDAAGARTNLSVPPTSRAINNGYGITGGGNLSADRTLAVSLSNSSAFLTTAQSITSASYADLSGCSVSLAAGTWLIVAMMSASAANLAFLAHLAITDASNTIVRETSQGVPASGASGVHQWANLALHAIVSPTSTTTYKLRAARGNTTLTNTYTAQDGSGQGVTNNASTNTDKATGIIAIRIA